MILLIGSLLALVLQSCSPTKNSDKSEVDNRSEIIMDFSEGPPLTLYKTKKDYPLNVAV